MCRTCGDEPRLRLGVERGALAHAEAVLLVDDDDGQAVEHDVGLHERVRADDERQLARRELAQRVRAPRRARRARQQRRAHRLAGHERLQRREVLLGERLGRRHEDRLHVVLDGAQDRVQRDDGLARADLAHQQALHRPRRGELLVELGDRALLVAGQCETAAAPRASAATAPAARRAPAPPPTPGAGRGGAAARAGRAAARRRPAGAGRPRGRRRERRRSPRGDRAGRRACAGARAPAAARRRARQPRGGRARARGSASTTGPRSPGSGRPRSRCRSASSVGAWLVTRNALRAAYLPCRTSRVPARVLARKPGLVEERRLHDARLVGDRRLDERLHPAAAHRAARDRAHLDDDRRDVAGHQRPHRARRAAVARQVLEQVAEREQAELRGGVGGLLRRDLQRRGEHRRPRPAQRRGQQRRVVELLRVRRRRWPPAHDDRRRGSLRAAGRPGVGQRDRRCASVYADEPSARRSARSRSRRVEDPSASKRSDTERPNAVPVKRTGCDVICTRSRRSAVIGASRLRVSRRQASARRGQSPPPGRQFRRQTRVARVGCARTRRSRSAGPRDDPPDRPPPSSRRPAGRRVQVDPHPRCGMAP